MRKRMRHVPPRYCSSVALTSLALIVAGCGTEGAQGKSGAQGATGATGPSGTEQTTSCTIPCHGFSEGLVWQWRQSLHSSESLASESSLILSSGQYCGNCHARDGIERRLAGEVLSPGAIAGQPTNVTLGHLNYQAADGSATRVLYSGEAISSAIHCTTCHAYTDATDPHQTGVFTQVPLRIPFGDDSVYFEKSPAAAVTGQKLAAYGAGNQCVFCHKSNADVTTLISPSKPVVLSQYWGPHEAPQADVYSGKGGYEFSGRTYESSVHSLFPTGCPKCHMAPVAANSNLPDHSLKVRLSSCTGTQCHTDPQSFDLATRAGASGAITVINAMLTELRALLTQYGAVSTDGLDGGADAGSGGSDSGVVDGGLAADGGAQGLLTLDSSNKFYLDTARSPGTPVDTNTAGALYNYLLVARNRGQAHNPIYAEQLLWDSISVLREGQAPQSLPVRPTLQP